MRPTPMPAAASFQALPSRRSNGRVGWQAGHRGVADKLVGQPQRVADARPADQPEHTARHYSDRLRGRRLATILLQAGLEQAGRAPPDLVQPEFLSACLHAARNDVRPALRAALDAPPSPTSGPQHRRTLAVRQFAQIVRHRIRAMVLAVLRAGQYSLVKGPVAGAMPALSRSGPKSPAKSTPRGLPCGVAPRSRSHPCGDPVV
jgi:hypothetical protein